MRPVREVREADVSGVRGANQVRRGGGAMKTAESWRAVLSGIPTHRLKASLNIKGLCEPVRNHLRAELVRRAGEPATGETVRDLAAEVAGR